jgi:hypothetical protein
MPQRCIPLPNIDKPIYSSPMCKLLLFMDAYSGYNQITMVENNEKKTPFMTELRNYYYNVMPFGLKNARALMDEIDKCTKL